MPGFAFVALEVREFVDLAMRHRDSFDPPVQRLFPQRNPPSKNECIGGYNLSKLGGVTFDSR
jgi:hypothetical protein